MLFASATASAGVRKVIATSTGPKISSCATVEAGETLVNSVGGYQQPFVGQRPGRLTERRAFGDAALHPAVDVLALDGVDNRADVDAFVQRIAHAQLAHAAA